MDRRNKEIIVLKTELQRIEVDHREMGHNDYVRGFIRVPSALRPQEATLKELNYLREQFVFQKMNYNPERGFVDGFKTYRFEFYMDDRHHALIAAVIRGELDMQLQQQEHDFFLYLRAHDEWAQRIEQRLEQKYKHKKGLKYQCFKCGHFWEPEDSIELQLGWKPTRCLKCKRADWDTPWFPCTLEERPGLLMGFVFQTLANYVYYKRVKE